MNSDWDKLLELLYTALVGFQIGFIDFILELIRLLR